MAAVAFDFGKHRGKPICYVPTSYLMWAISQCNCVLNNSWLLASIHAELVKRGFTPPSAPGEPSRTGNLSMEKVIQTWWREQVKIHHPDRGGNTAVMQALNNAHQRLKELANL